MKAILEQEKEINDYVISIRRELHQIPEIGFDLPKSQAVIIRELEQLGYQPQVICPAGIIVEIGRGEEVLLLRADYDGLPIAELTDLPFKATNGKMHACGHDIHAAMLLGTAKLLKQNETRLNCRIRLMFQPAEEIGLGAKAMIDAGVLTDVNKAYMIHVVSGAGSPNGKFIFPTTGPVLSSSTQLKVDIQGIGAHGSMPHFSVDATMVAVHTAVNLQNIISREISPFDPAVISIGSIQSGDAYNIIADRATLKGTVRAFSRENSQFLNQRITEICTKTAETFRASCTVELDQLMSSFIQDANLATETMTTLSTVFKQDDFTPLASLIGEGRIMGSEDYAFISEQVPTNMWFLGLGAGQAVSLHNPNLVFEEDYLYMGPAAFLALALNQ